MITPQVLSAGHGAMHIDLGAEVALRFILLVLVVKIAASTISLGFGFRGGLFFASLFIGSLVGQLFAGAIARVPIFPAVDPSDAALRRDIGRLGELWNEGLARFGGPFLAGPAFTAVDAFYAPVAFRIQSYGLVLDEASMAYAQRLLDLPAMREWYAAALAETWRDPEHEEEAKQFGTLLEDLRTPAA